MELKLNFKRRRLFFIDQPSSIGRTLEVSSKTCEGEPEIRGIEKWTLGYCEYLVDGSNVFNNASPVQFDLAPLIDESEPAVISPEQYARPRAKILESLHVFKPTPSKVTKTPATRKTTLHSHENALPDLSSKRYLKRAGMMVVPRQSAPKEPTRKLNSLAIEQEEAMRKTYSKTRALRSFERKRAADSLNGVVKELPRFQLDESLFIVKPRSGKAEQLPSDPLAIKDAVLKQLQQSKHSRALAQEYRQPACVIDAPDANSESKKGPSLPVEVLARVKFVQAIKTPAKVRLPSKSFTIKGMENFSIQKLDAKPAHNAGQSKSPLMKKIRNQFFMAKRSLRPQ